MLLLGCKFVQSVSFPKKYTISEPAVGGLLMAIALLVLEKSMDWEVNFDVTLCDPLMLAFFIIIGLNANITSLRAGGCVVGILLTAVVGLLPVQNAIGTGMMILLGLGLPMDLIAGSVTPFGGHGTGAVWSELPIERYGFTNVTEVAMAYATLSLVLSGLVGDPVTCYLVRHSTALDGMPDDQTVPTAFEKPGVGRMITSLVLIEIIALIATCLTVDKIATQMPVGIVLELPIFVRVLFVGVTFSSGLALLGFYRVLERVVPMLGNVGLSLFPAMALISPKLWELASLALSILAILVMQTIFMVLYAIFATWRVMGKNYGAAVLIAGHCGFGLDATPIAIADMQVITERFGPSHMAFLMVSMMGAFSIDIVNALVIKLYLLLPTLTQ